MIITQLFDSENVEFTFQKPVDLVIENLSSRVLAQGQPATGGAGYRVESMIGSVDRDGAFIYRFVPGSRNSFRPTFYGDFNADENATTLKGEIRLNKVIAKFIVFWCVLVAIVVVSTVVSVLRNPAASWGSLLYVVLMFIACVAFFRWMIGKAKPDVDWLKKEITNAANAEPDDSSVEVST